MSEESAYYIAGMNKEDLEIQLALQCAPVINNLKVSNLLIIYSFQKNLLEEFFNGTKIQWEILYDNGKTVTLFVYHKQKMEEYLMKKAITNFLREVGYKTGSLGMIIKECGNRYEKYMNSEALFPHELGLLLGYPMEDVDGYIKNKGRNELYCGYWKVYGNKEETLELFQRFHEVREEMIWMLKTGISIKKLLNRECC